MDSAGNDGTVALGGGAMEIFSRLIYRYCGEYRPTQAMNDRMAIIGKKDYFIVTSNGECHFELSGFDLKKIYEIEGD